MNKGRRSRNPRSAAVSAEDQPQQPRNVVGARRNQTLPVRPTGCGWCSAHTAALREKSSGRARILQRSRTGRRGRQTSLDQAGRQFGGRRADGRECHQGHLSHLALSLRVSEPGTGPGRHRQIPDVDAQRRRSKGREGRGLLPAAEESAQLTKPALIVSSSCDHPWGGRETVHVSRPLFFVFEKYRSGFPISTCGARFQACCLAGFQACGRSDRSVPPPAPTPRRLGSRCHSRFGNLRYRQPTIVTKTSHTSFGPPCKLAGVTSLPIIASCTAAEARVSKPAGCASADAPWHCDTPPIGKSGITDTWQPARQP